ncbi:unnamed protein product, partial [Adineta steineri]
IKLYYTQLFMLISSRSITLLSLLSEHNTQQTLSELRFKQLQCIIACQIFLLPFILDLII